MDCNDSVFSDQILAHLVLSQIRPESWLKATNENLPPNVIKQLVKELKNLDETPPEGIKVGVNDDNFSVIYADIEGPAGTPYENGVFRMKLILSHDFPHSPPKGL
ncbi:ubiquitin-conjugating enzyme family protein [Striga asiatica]|uniref:Ubiquitin-conjugating enzyme family protein n=1 Tax=Striga asiatica TaxID=4170 RepID=A0A5A7R4H8_STRAF|nr:ubiquitin-conjugating enzyme family protein [Striga asiatica]